MCSKCGRYVDGQDRCAIPGCRARLCVKCSKRIPRRCGLHVHDPLEPAAEEFEDGKTPTIFPGNWYSTKAEVAMAPALELRAVRPRWYAGVCTLPFSVKLAVLRRGSQIQWTSSWSVE